MRRKRIMIIGAGCSGKSLLGRRLEQAGRQLEQAERRLEQAGTTADSKNRKETVGGENGLETTAGSQTRPGTAIDPWSRRTPVLVYRGTIIEAPGAYLESPWMRHHLIAAAQDASCVLMLVDLMGNREIYPPGFAMAFRVPVLGIVTKCDLIQTGRRGPEPCFWQLARAGIKKPYLMTSAKDGDGLKALCREIRACCRTPEWDGNKMWLK